MLGSGWGFKIVLGCKMDKIFLQAPFVRMARRAPSVPILLKAAPLATNCWPEAPKGGGGVGALGPAESPLCDIPSGCCSFTGPWTVTRSSLRMLRRVATFCRPLWPVLLLVSFPRSRSPVVGVLGLCWMRHGVPFACQRRPIVGVLRMCWLLPGSFDCFCCPHTSVHRPSIACLAVFLCGPGAFHHALSGPSTICPFPPHGWSAPDGLPLLLRKQPIWAVGDTPHPAGIHLRY